MSAYNIYTESCERFQCKPNADFLRLLPTEASLNGIIAEVDLTANLVGRKGILPVLDVIKTCINCRRASFARNNLDNASIKDIVNALSDHPSLTSLDLSGNPISNPAGRCLTQYVVTNTKCVQIVLEETLINPALIRSIAKKVEQNSTRNFMVSTECSAHRVSPRGKLLQADRSFLSRFTLPHKEAAEASDDDRPELDLEAHNSMLSRSSAGGTYECAGLRLLLSTCANQSPPTDMEEWWYLRTTTMLASPTNTPLAASVRRSLDSLTGMALIFAQRDELPGRFQGIDILRSLS